MKRKTLYFTAPRQVEIREESLPALEADDVLVETICSAISAGTEMLVYQGRFPRDLETDALISSLRGGFSYPCVYGYAAVGRITETGTQVDKSWRDKLVFAFQPHTSHFICKPESFFFLPYSLSPEIACFLPNMETAVNLVQDAAPIFGERVLVLGQGIVGLLTTSLLSEFPLETLVTADCYELRRDSSPGHLSLDPYSPDFRKQALVSLHQGADLTFELSGRPETLNDALALTGFSGRIVIGSWYGEKRAEIDLGGTFHRSRIKLISSQVSTIAPELSGRWNKARRFDVAWKALERIKPEKWITHHFPIDHAEEAYQLLDEKAQETIQVVIHYNT
ncbi:MAG TPA: zinc-binding alcohol dehydrogenase [Anaerolineales bacterium]|nr:zinc-binding alcohol dehydrogenase [Anaerolineales bacterium]